MVCVWKKSTFQPLTLIILIVLVNTVATPIYIVITYLIDGVLLAPTAEDVVEQVEYVRYRRKSAVQVANRRQREALSLSLPASVAPLQLGEQQQQQQQGEEQQQEQCEQKQQHDHQQQHEQNQEGGPSERFLKPVVFKTFSKVDERVLKRQQNMRETMNRSKLFQSIDADRAVQETHFDSFDNLITDLSYHSNFLVGRKRKDFKAKWPIDNKQAMAALDDEFKEVGKATMKWKQTLKQTPPATRGIRLLQLFVQDLIGRKSRQARVFVNHLEKQQLEEKMVMNLGAKALAFTVILLLNGYFIFSCMLYGREKGISIA